MQTLGAVKKTYQVWWLIGIDGERESREYILSACLDDDDDYSLNIYAFIKENVLKRSHINIGYYSLNIYAFIVENILMIFRNKELKYISVIQ